MQRYIVGLLVLAIGAILILSFLRNSHRNQVETSAAVSTTGQIDLTSSRFEEWLEYTSPTKKFHALFPTLPQHTNKVDKDPKTQEVRNQEIYVAEERDGTLYMIYSISYENKNEIDDTFVKSILDEILLKNTEGKTLNLNKTTKNGKNAVTFEIVQNDIIAKGEAFTVGNTIYILDVVAKASNWNPSEYEFFVNSLDAKLHEKDNEKNGPLK